MPDRDLQDRTCAVAKPQEIRFADLKIREQRGYIIRILLKRLRAFPVARSAMALRFEGNYPAMAANNGNR